MKSPQIRSVMSWRVWLMAAATSLILSACGGGGGGGDAAPAATGVVDSFGQPVAANDASGVGPGDSGADGTAGEGKAIVGAQVQITDATGKTAAATTDAQGYYRLKVTGMTPPFVAKVTKADGSALRSLSTATLKVGGFITLNLTGLTDKVASDVAVAAGKNGAADLTPALVAANGGAVNNALSNLRTQLSSTLQAASLDPGSFNPLSMPFRPNYTGYDFVLDNTVVTVGANGATTVAALPVSFAGNWSLSVMVAGQTAVAGNVPGSAVPIRSAVLQSTAADATKYVVPTSVTSGQYIVTSSGNTVTITGPNTNFTVTVNSFSFTNYQVNGNGGVGTTVSMTLNINYTESGLLAGQSIPTSTTAATVGLSYQRTS